MKFQIQPHFNNKEEWLELAQKKNCVIEALEPSCPWVDVTEELIQWYKDTGLVESVHGAFVDVSPGSETPEIRDRSREAYIASCQLAMELGAKNVVFHSTALPHIRGYYLEGYIKYNAEFLRELAERFPLNIYIENFVDCDSEPIVKLIEACDHERIKACLDVGHAHFSGERIEDWFRDLEGRIGYLHFSDNTGRADDHLPIGTGNIDWEMVHEYVMRLPKDTPVTLEIRKVEDAASAIAYFTAKGLMGYGDKTSAHAASKSGVAKHPDHAAGKQETSDFLSDETTSGTCPSETNREAEPDEKKVNDHEKKASGSRDESDISTRIRKERAARKRKRLIIIAIIAALVIAFGIWFLVKSNSGNADGEVYVQSVAEMTGSSYGANRYGGVVETQKVQEVQFDSSRKLKECYVTVGQSVKKGDKLFCYDTKSTELEIQQIQIEIEKLDTTISNNNKQIAELKASMGAASSEDKLAYNAQIKQLETENAQAEYDKKTKGVTIETKQSMISKAVITSPIDGTIQKIRDLNLSDDGGDLSSGGYSTDNISGDSSSGISSDSSSNNDSSGSGTGTPYISIVTEGDFRIKCKVSEQNVYEIIKEQPVIIRSRVDDSVWAGTVTSINTQPESTSGETDIYGKSSDNASSQYTFYVEPENCDGMILGQHVVVELDYGQTEQKEGLWLAGTWFVMDGDETYAWVVEEPGDKLEKRIVTLGDYDEELDEYQVLDGIKETDYLAWPDETCQESAVTTTMVVEDASETYESE